MPHKVNAMKMCAVFGPVCHVSVNLHVCQHAFTKTVTSINVLILHFCYRWSINSETLTGQRLYVKHNGVSFHFA